MLILFFQLAFTQILFESNFISSQFSTSESWSITNGNLGFELLQNMKTIYGGRNYFGAYTHIQKGFTLPPHYMIRVQIQIWTFGGWDDGEINLLCDENRIYSQRLYSMIDTSHSAPISLNLVTSHNAVTAFIQVRPTKMEQLTQSWGIRDFSISYYACPSGCTICEKTETSSICSQWIQSYSQLTSLSITELTNEGWFINNDKEYFRFNECNGLPFFGTYNYGMILKRTFYLEPHDRLKIQFLLIKLNDWGLSKLFLKIDNVIQKQITDNNNIYHNINYCDSNSGLDSIQRITIDFAHSKQFSEFQIYTTLSSTQLSNSFGIRDFTIFIKECITCLRTAGFSTNVIQYFTQTSFPDSQGWAIQGMIDEAKLYICGDKTIFGLFGAGDHLIRQFTLTPHQRVRISLSFYCVDSWGDEYAYVAVDGTVQYSFMRRLGDGIELCGIIPNNHYQWKETIQQINFFLPHTSSTITIDIYTNLDEVITNGILFNQLESFGFRDFKLEVAGCPFDCTSCNEVSGDYCEFQYQIEDWSLNDPIFTQGYGWGQYHFVDTTPQVTQCNGKSLLGGFGSIINQSYLQLIYILDLHIKIRLIFKLYIIGDWLDDQLIVTVNGSPFYKKLITTSYSNFYCQTNLQAYIINFDQVIIDDSSALEIYITNTIDLFPKNNSIIFIKLESFGVRDVQIFYQPT